MDDKFANQQGDCLAQDVETDVPSNLQTTTTVLLDDSVYTIPKAATMPLESTTFNAFADLLVDLDTPELTQLDINTLIRLYRRFIESQFSSAERDALLEAFQRVGGHSTPNRSP